MTKRSFVVYCQGQQFSDHVVDHAAMLPCVPLVAAIKEAYGTVAVFADLYGNRWDLLELKSGD